MINKQVLSGVLLDESVSFSFIEVCEQCTVSEEFLRSLVEYGLFGEFEKPYEEVVFNQKMVFLVRKANRLQRDLELNIAGVVLACELLEELDTVKNELEILKRHFSLP